MSRRVAAGSGAAERAYEILTERAHGRAERGAPLAGWTSYRIGGPAAVLLEAAGPADLDAVAAASRETGLEVLVIGRGSNVLVSDRGFPGVGLRLGAGFRWAHRSGDAIEAGSAMPLPALANLALHERLGGLEFAVAIPASVGGAVRMNAGAHGRSMSEVVEWAEVYRLEEARAVRLAGSEMGFEYRSTALPPRSIVTAARLALAPAEAGRIAEGMREAREWRRHTQPLNLPNAGSVFKNPPGDFAARLVEQHCGKGLKVGGARVSEVHANFIVTEAGATADDVYSLVRRIQRAVREATGIELELEMKLIGDFEEVDDAPQSR